MTCKKNNITAKADSRGIPAEINIEVRMRNDTIRAELKPLPQSFCDYCKINNAVLPLTGWAAFRSYLLLLSDYKFSVFLSVSRSRLISVGIAQDAVSDAFVFTLNPDAFKPFLPFRQLEFLTRPVYPAAAQA